MLLLLLLLLPQRPESAAPSEVDAAAAMAFRGDPATSNNWAKVRGNSNTQVLPVWWFKCVSMHTSVVYLCAATHS